MTVAGGELAGRVEGLLARHQTAAGVEAAAVHQAPGRVNLLGEHTDYSGGFCMPAAISFNTLVAASPRADSLLRMHSVDFGELAEVDLRALRVPAKDAATRWNFYCEGTAWSLAQEAGIELCGADLTITGNVPLGAGLSSSASVEVATASALLGIAGQTLPKVAVALACQRAENQYVHGSCGIMDQYISACGVRGNALAIDTRALTAELAPIPEDLRLVVCNSMVTHKVAGASPYAERRREVEEAARAMGRQLRDVSLEELVDAKGKMSHEAFLRGRHVIMDSARVGQGVALLKSGDSAGFGRLMTAAHASFRDDFGASCEACDLLVRLALELDGCLGSRLTGGGFGGCTVSLVKAEAAEGFREAMTRGYKAAAGVLAQVFVCEIADGAGVLG
jgi:galactokinase